MKGENESLETQLFYLKKVGQILEHMDKIRQNTDLKVLFLNELHESNFIVNEKNHELYVIDLDSCRIRYTQPTLSKYLTSKSLINTVQGKYQFADPDCPTYGYVIADENSDLLCYVMMFLNFIYGENVVNFSLDEYYDYL